MRKKFRILSIDGGGLKGLIAIKILQVIETITGAPTGEQFDLLAGTSTGGLICCALSATTGSNAAAYNLEHIEKLYLKVGEEVYLREDAMVAAEEAAKLDKLLVDTFRQQRLSDVHKPVFVPAYDLERGRLVVFKSRTAMKDLKRDVPLVQVCRATSAISPVFPPYTLLYNGSRLVCVDAGAHLKNPALCALAEVWENRDFYRPDLREEDIVLLSVSTGTHRKKGSEWSTNIKEVLNSQRMDMDYIRTRKLDLDFTKVNYMRVDMNLGGSSFSLEQLLTWLARIEKLSVDQKFGSAAYRLLMPDGR